MVPRFWYLQWAYLIKGKPVSRRDPRVELHHNIWMVWNRDYRVKRLTMMPFSV